VNFLTRIENFEAPMSAEENPQNKYGCAPTKQWQTDFGT